MFKTLLVLILLFSSTLGAHAQSTCYLGPQLILRMKADHYTMAFIGEVDYDPEEVIILMVDQNNEWILLLSINKATQLCVMASGVDAKGSLNGWRQ